MSSRQIGKKFVLRSKLCSNRLVIVKRLAFRINTVTT